MLKTIGKKFNRALHFDFHTPPGIENLFGNFDAERFAEQLADAKIEFVNITARCNMGFSYYNTKVGKKYAGLGDRDPFREILDACHKRGIGVTAYLNLGLNHEMAADHLDWLKIDQEGRVYQPNKKDSFFRVMCHNTPYRAHFLEEIKEVCAYDIDGLFCDCFCLKPCYCPACMADMAKRGVDATDEAAVLDYQNKVRFEVAKGIYEALGEKKGKIKLYFNGISWTLPYQTHAEIECLTSTPKWGYDYFDSMAAYTRTKFEDRVYMSGRFQNSWGDFGGLKPLASMQNDLYDAMMNSFGISFGDHLHPVDGFEPKVAERLKAVMEEKLAYEPYTENSDNLVEIGVIMRSNDVTRRTSHFSKGAARALKELKRTYNIYDENGPFDEDGLKLLILCESAGFDASFKERLRRYIEKGGKVLFIGTAVDLGKEIGVLDYIESEPDPRDNAYYTTPDSDLRIAMYAPARILKNNGGRELAKYVDNVFDYIWDGRHSYKYRPQGNPTDYSAAVVGENTACICFDLLDAYADNFLLDHRTLLEQAIDALLPERLIQAPNLPKTATVALTKNAEHTVFHVKTTYPEHKMNRGIIEEHIWMKSVPVSIRGDYREVHLLPEMTKLESRIEGDRILFETGDILGYKAFLLK
ncbi:MAG: alpha-L-fucosidase [Clostridia bacterium]|nr:alpha-L-fucosidase [Clostridia bacterium]